MALEINVRQLENAAIALEGDLEAAALDLDTRDDLVRVSGQLRYRVTVERLGESLVIQGRLDLSLQCTCVRCLRAFDRTLTFEDWVCHMPLEGEDRAMINHDVVDLTPYVREDILLALPQHPLCESGCCGLPSAPRTEAPQSGLGLSGDRGMSVWADLDKLNF